MLDETLIFVANPFRVEQSKRRPRANKFQLFVHVFPSVDPALLQVLRTVARGSEACRI